MGEPTIERCPNDDCDREFVNILVNNRCPSCKHALGVAP